MSREFCVFTLNCYAIAYAPILSSPFRKQRIDAIMDHIEKSNYDIVCLQEVWTEGDQVETLKHYLYFLESLSVAKLNRKFTFLGANKKSLQINLPFCYFIFWVYVFSLNQTYFFG